MRHSSVLAKYHSDYISVQSSSVATRVILGFLFAKLIMFAISLVKILKRIPAPLPSFALMTKSIIILKEVHSFKCNSHIHKLSIYCKVFYQFLTDGYTIHLDHIFTNLIIAQKTIQ